jgi:Flp pilus assembly protein TadG
MLHSFAAAIARLRRLVERQEGIVAIIFALCAIPIFIAAGMAVDIGRAYAVKVRLGAALDAAALAVGSQSNQTATQLTTDLQNYFTANYPATALGGATATVTPVPSTASLSASTVNYQATATVPMTLMRIIGINSITVTASAQTQKTTGLEIAVVLDNTGSMLCGPNDGAPNYSNATCGTGVVAADTTCTNAANGSRICTLINAATQFVNTLTNAISSAQQLYISVIPYVTTVNVGNALCTGATSCTNIATTGGDFTDLRGNIMPVTPIIGTTTSGSSTVSSVSMQTPSGSVSGTAAIQQGMSIYGHGIPSPATVSSVSGSSITISSNANLTFAGNSLAVGPSSGNLSNPYTDPTTYTGGKATLSKTSTTVTLSTGTTTNNVVAGMAVSGTGIAAGTTVATVVSATQITLSADPSANEAPAESLTFSLTGKTTSGSTTVSTLAGSPTSLSSIVVGMMVNDASGKIPVNTTYVTSVSTAAKTLTLSASATGTVAGDTLTFTNLGATTTAGSTTISNVSFTPTVPSVGQVIIGNGIPANTTITTVTGTAAQFAAGTGQLAISNAATTPSNFSAATGTCCNTALVAFSPLTYDSTYNSASPAGSSTTTNWGGCVVEPTSSAENSSGTGVVNAAVTDPDYSEPTSGLNWYPLWWANDSTNTWATNGVKAQSTATETQGATATDWLTLYGPNQGCPVPMIPLTDATTAAGKTTILNTISSMWPRDAGGTQVHIGMIWGWRALSSNGPFASNNGHPLSYSNASSTGWKKVVVLMTDGTEEWPAADNMTGLGQITDGKIDTTSTGTAVTNLGTRLADVCSNMAASGNFVIYTIGLGTDGASNTDLQNCPGNTGGYFEPATTSNLQTVFQDIAKSLLALRLTQ